MRKKLSILIPLLVLCAFIAVAGTITIAGSGANSTDAAGQTPAIRNQMQTVLDAIAKRDLKTADSAYNKLITEYDKNDALAEAVYKISLEYQYKNWNSMKANEGHKFVVDSFPDTKYGLLSSVEIIRSQLRSGKNADSDVEKWMSTYKNRHDLADEVANGIYLIAQAYSGNNHDDKAFPLFEYVSKTYPKNVYGLLAQVRIDAINKDYDAADAVADYVIARYRDNAEVEKAIRSLAEYYRGKKEYSRAIHFYMSELDSRPNPEDAVTAYRESIYCYIDMNDIESADSLIEQMQRELAHNPKLARTNFDIGNYFLNNAKDPANALRIHRYNTAHYTDSLESLWSQAAIVWYYVRAGDEENAYIEYARMLAVYKDESTLPKEVAQVGDRYLEVDNSEKARELYQQVLDEWPESQYVFNAKTGFIKADIHDGYDEAAMTGIDALIAKFKDNRQLPGTVLMFGEGYYNKGLKIYPGKALPGLAESSTIESNRQKAIVDFENSLSIWLMTIDALETKTINANDSITAEFYHYAGTCNRLLSNYDKALEYYYKVINDWPEYEAANCVAGIIPHVYEMMKQDGLISGDSADKLIIDAYQQVLDRFPTSSGAKAANDKIYMFNKEAERAKQIEQNRNSSTPFFLRAMRGGAQ